MAHFNRTQQYELIKLLENNDLKGCIEYINNNIKSGVSWLRDAAKFKQFLSGLINQNYDYIPFTILKKDGNKKKEKL